MKRLTMKAAMMTMATTVTMTLAMTALTACSSDDDNNKNEQTEEDATELAAIQERQQAALMLDALCRTDSVTGQLVPRLGEAIQSPTPTVYYAIANTVEEARGSYENIVGATRTDMTDTTPLPDDVTRGDVHVTFAESRAEGETARITVDCPQLRDVLTSIVFVPDEAWPENDDIPSPFNFLSLWYQQNIGIYWICVREAKGSDGLLLTFDGGWWTKTFDDYTYWQGEFWLYTDLADPETIKCLAEGIRFQRDKFNAMVDRMAKKDSNAGTYKILKRLKNNEYITFDRYFDWDYHLWKAHYCYDVTVYRCAILPNNTYITGSNYYTHEDTPTRCEPSHHITFTRDFKLTDDWVPVSR